MATKCLRPLRGKVVRITELDECGALTENSVYVVSEGFITVSISADYEAGDEFVVKNANGRLCINERAPDELKRLNLDIDFCEVDPDIMNLILGAPLETDGSDTVGFRIKEGSSGTAFALELWTGLAGSGACDDGGACYGYVLLPFVTGATLSGDTTFGNQATNFAISAYTQGNSQWEEGPYEVIGTNDSPTVLEDPIAPDEHALVRQVCVAPPAPECGSFLVDSTSA